MKSLKTREDLSSSISQNAGKIAATPAKATKKNTANTLKKGSTSRQTAKAADVTEPPKRNVTKKKTIKNPIKFDKKITDKLKKIVSNYTEYPELLDNIERDTTKSFIDELNIDSVDFVEIIVDVEQEFDITIEDDEIYDLKSFEDLYSAIETKIKQAKK